MKGIKESTTEPESRYYVKDERTKQFAYSFQAASDLYGFILGSIVTPGNVHDSYMLQPLAADAAYKTPAINKFLFEHDIQPALPNTRPKTKDGFLRKHEYVYDEYYDCYLCLEGSSS